MILTLIFQINPTKYRYTIKNHPLPQSIPMANDGNKDPSISDILSRSTSLGWTNEQTNRLIICQSISCQLIFGPNHEIPTSPPLNGNKYKSNSPHPGDASFHQFPSPSEQNKFIAPFVLFAMRPVVEITRTPILESFSVICGRKLYSPPNQIDISLREFDTSKS